MTIIQNRHLKNNLMASAPTLDARGIATAARAAGWTTSRDGWSYPVVDLDGHEVARRFKRSRGQGAKYLWLTDRQNAQYYFPDWKHFRTALARSDGELWIASGEPDALVFVAAGFSNVLCWFGERAVPETLGADLQAWGVKRVYYPADHDDTGRGSAASVRARLAESGIDYYPLSWGDDAPPKYDINKLWIDCAFDRGRFIDKLTTLAPLLLPRESREPEISFDWASEDTPPDLIEQIAQRLRVTHRRTDAAGWITGQKLPNPIDPHEHDDSNPGCSFNRRTGVLYDHKSDRGYSPYALADHFGLPYRRPARTLKPDEPDWQACLPDARAVWESLPDYHHPMTVESTPSPHDSRLPHARLDTPCTARDAARWPDYADGLTWGEIQWSWVLPGDFRTFLYTGVKTGIYRGATPDEWAAAAETVGLAFSASSMRWQQRQHELMTVVDTNNEQNSLCTKFDKNRRGRPVMRLALPERRVLHRLIKAYGYARLFELAVTDGKQVLPAYVRAELLEALGIEAEHENALLAALDAVIDRLKTTDPEFKRRIDLSWGRFKTWYLQLCNDLERSDFADDFEIDPDLHNVDTPRMIFAAQLMRLHRDRRAGQPTSRLDWCVLTGVSNGSLKKISVLSGTRRVGGKPPVKLVKLVAATPADAPRELAIMNREVKGKPRYIHTSGGTPIPYNTQNLMAAVLSDETPIYIEYSVAGPWEAYTPTPDERAALKATRTTTQPVTPADAPARKRRRKHYEGRKINPIIARRVFEEILLAAGWQRDEGAYWTDPLRRLWPDHLPTLMQALTGVPVIGAREPMGEKDMSSIHHSSEKYDREPVPLLKHPQGAPAPAELPYLKCLTLPTLLTPARDRRRYERRWMEGVR